MKLLKFSYNIDAESPFVGNSVVIEPVDFSEFNLMVGKNASGKSTIVKYLFIMIELLKGSKENGLNFGKYYIEIQKDESTVYKYTYELIIKLEVSEETESKYKANIETKELLYENETLLLKRDKTSCKLWSVISKKLIEIAPPEQTLVLHVRRDKKDFPYFEDIIDWATGAHYLKFGHIHSSSFFNYGQKGGNSFNPFRDNPTSLNENIINDIIGDLSSESRDKIRNEFNTLNYDVEKLEIAKMQDQNTIHVKESNIQNGIYQNNLSQGMYRCLFLLIFIHHFIEKANCKLLIIDDLAEGLDYDRASRLGKLLVDKMAEYDVQFVATSNDNFLMNVINIKYWTIVQRDSSNIKVFNYKNSKDKFDYFRKMGMNNFDMFSSDFINSK